MVRGGTTGDPKRGDVQIGPRGSLPWLDDVATESGGFRKYAGWMVAAALVVIAGAYFFAVQGLRRPAPPSPTATTTIPLAPQPVTAVAPPTARKAPAPARPAPASREAAAGPVGEAKRPARASAPRAPAAPAAPAQPAATPAKAAAKRAAAPKATVAQVPSPGARPGAVFPLTNGATAAAEARVPRPGAGSVSTGQVVQLGAFPTVEQAKPVWRAMERSFPPLRNFRASLIENRDWNGRLFYQFEVGTASQADSEMLCQSMASRNFRCTVAGRP